MGNREILKTEDVLVRIMELDKDSGTDWHYHTQVADIFVCMVGMVQVETRDPKRKIPLLPGEHTQVVPRQIHRVINLGEGSSEYLLIQGIGSYDFCVEEKP